MLFKPRLLKKESAGTSTVRKCKQAKRVRRSRGSLFVEAALLLLLAVPTVATLTYFAHAYVTKARLGDSARVIARAIQDDPGITQSFVANVGEDFGGPPRELEKVVSAATGVTGDGVPAGFNVSKYKECNPDIAGLSDSAARNHFARAGRYENRTGVYGNCGVHSDVGARDVRVSITSFPSKPSDSAIADLVPPNGGVSDGLHGSGRWHTHGEFYGYKYTNPHSNPSKPYWVTVVAKKPFPHLSLFGLPEVKSSSTVRVVPAPNSVTLLQHCSFDPSDGFSATIKPGRYSKITKLGLLDNHLSALRISPGTEVTLYEDENFGGRAIKLTSNTDCLTEPTLNFNDITSSLVIKIAPAPTPAPAPESDKPTCVARSKNCPDGYDLVTTLGHSYTTTTLAPKFNSGSYTTTHHGSTVLCCRRL